jgi:hypothetical protein
MEFIEPFLPPPQVSKLISPCDNSFLASGKARLQGLDTATTEVKEATFLRICEGYDAEVVRHSFAHCGWEF